MRLPAEHPRLALARDEALLDQVQAGGAALERWYVAGAPAVVLGLGLRQRVLETIDVERCRVAGIDVLDRRSGGGAVLVGPETMLCGAICMPLPHVLLGDDLTESYRWLGRHVRNRLAEVGVASVRRVEVAEARSDVGALRLADDTLSRLLLSTCYGALSPHELVVGSAKLVGLAQVRRRHAALFQVGVLLQDQSGLADVLRVPDEPAREALRAALRRRTIGLAQLSESPWDLPALAHRLSLTNAAPELRP